MLKNVIDISQHNILSSFEAVKNNRIVGVINKAAKGRTFVDAKNHARRHRVLDGGTMTRAQATQFLTLVEQQTGRFPGLYSGQFFIGEKVGNNTTTVLKNCFLWIARYSSTRPIAPPAWTSITPTVARATKPIKSPASDAVTAKNSTAASTD